MIIKTSYPFMKPPPSARLIRGHRSAQGLVGLWTMAENGGLQVFDLSEYGNTGTILNSMPWVPSKFGSGLQSDGSEVNEKCIQIPNSNIFSFGDTFTDKPFSVVVWYKQTENTGSDLIIMKGDETNNTIEWMFYTWDGGIRFRMFDNTAGIHIRQIGDSAMSLGWHQIVGTYTGDGTTGGIKQYLDGQLDPSTADSGGSYTAMHSTVADLYIGVMYYNDESNDEFSHGTYDQVSIYNRVLSAGEIAELYAKPFGMLERRARTALMSGYEVVVPPEGIVVLRRRRESA